MSIIESRVAVDLKKLKNALNHLFIYFFPPYLIEEKKGLSLEAKYKKFKKKNLSRVTMQVCVYV